MNRSMTAICLALALSAPAMADMGTAKQEKAAAKAAKETDNERLYRKGSRAIDDEQWSDAIATFSEIVRRGGSDTDRALYWLAHAQYKSGRASEALSSISTLRQKFPKSSWIDDAKALELEIRQSSGQHVAPEAIQDDELKLIAITSLMNADPERAVPMLEKMLHSGNSDTKERALFVLGQIQTPSAAKALEAAARGSYGADVQEEAIHAIATTAAGRNKQLLLDVFQSSHDENVKESILDAFMVMGDREQLVRVASAEPSPDLRSEAARLLGTMHATAELDRLYATEKSQDVKEDIIQAFFIAGDVDKLAALARTEPNADLRGAAIQGLGTSGAKRTAGLLLELWNGARDGETKEAILDALFVQNNATALIGLARKEQDREMKREIVQRLSNMHSKEAQDYMLELLRD